MKCTKCGYENKEDATFCDLCKEVLSSQKKIIIEPKQEAVNYSLPSTEDRTKNLLMGIMILGIGIMPGSLLGIILRLFQIKYSLTVIIIGTLLAILFSIAFILFVIGNRILINTKTKKYVALSGASLAFLLSMAGLTHVRSTPWGMFLFIVANLWLLLTVSMICILSFSKTKHINIIVVLLGLLGIYRFRSPLGFLYSNVYYFFACIPFIISGFLSVRKFQRIEDGKYFRFFNIVPAIAQGAVFGFSYLWIWPIIMSLMIPSYSMSTEGKGFLLLFSIIVGIPIGILLCTLQRYFIFWYLRYTRESWHRKSL